MGWSARLGPLAGTPALASTRNLNGSLHRRGFFFRSVCGHFPLTSPRPPALVTPPRCSREQILGASHAHGAASAFVYGLPGVPATTTTPGLGRTACSDPNRRRATYSAYSNGRLPSSFLSSLSSLSSPSLPLTAWATPRRPCFRRLRRRSAEAGVRLPRGSVFGSKFGSGSEVRILHEPFNGARCRYRRRCRVAVSLAAATEATSQAGDDRDGGTRVDDGAGGRVEGLRLFNTEGRRKQPFVPQDRR